MVCVDTLYIGMIFWSYFLLFALILFSEPQKTRISATVRARGLLFRRKIPLLLYRRSAN